MSYEWLETRSPTRLSRGFLQQIPLKGDGETKKNQKTGRGETSETGADRTVGISQDIYLAEGRSGCIGWVDATRRVDRGVPSAG